MARTSFSDTVALGVLVRERVWRVLGPFHFFAFKKTMLDSHDGGSRTSHNRHQSV
jgi:hypothetical protein